MLQIKLKEKNCRTLSKFDLMHIPDILGSIKMSNIECVQISYILIELSEMVVCDFGLSDLRCLRNGIYIYFSG